MKKVLLIVLIAVIIIIAALIIYVTHHLPKVPLKEVKVESTPEKLEKGKYLANHVAVCIDCHSTRDWTKFSGPITAGTDGKGGEVFDQKMGFPGSYVAPNITPFHLKDWTDAEIYRAITSGVSKNGRPLFPIMPYIRYGELDNEDLFSIIAYLRTLPEVENATKDSKSDFPMSIIIHTIPKVNQPSQRPDTADKVKYGKYLVNAASCIDCHTKAEKGQLIEEMAYAGGREFPMPFGIIASANITPDDETGIGSWTEDVFVNRFKAYDLAGNYQPESVKPDEFNSLMPWIMYAGMKTEDLVAIFAYLKTLKPISNKVEKFKMNNTAEK